MPGIMKALNNISRCQAVYRKKSVGEADLHPSQYAFVLTISHSPGRSQEELARELCVDKSTVARVLACLEKNGYITRAPNEKDRRQTLVYPTEKMLEVRPKIQQANRAWTARLTRDIPPGDLEIFHRVLERLEQSAKTIMDELEVK